jgi:Domain of unknown function (DUF6265)
MRVRLASLLAAACCGAALAQPAPATAQLGWLAGCWAAAGGEAGSGEQWMAPAGGSMLGASRTLRGGSVRTFEFLHIRDSAQGLVLIAMPSGQKPATFAAERVQPRGVTFHNPDHDYPQRVIYESPDDDTLDARIEGQVNGQQRVIRFAMKRSAGPLGSSKP